MSSKSWDSQSSNSWLSKNASDRSIAKIAEGSKKKKKKWISIRGQRRKGIVYKPAFFKNQLKKIVEQAELEQSSSDGDTNSKGRSIRLSHENQYKSVSFSQKDLATQDQFKNELQEKQSSNRDNLNTESAAPRSWKPS